jgi:amino acid adenylation domain-containing protein
MSKIPLSGAPRDPPAAAFAAAPRGEAVVDRYPLTHMQQAMLLADERDGRTGLYVQQFVLSLREPLRVPAFRAAWQHLADRHPVLRTSFLLNAHPEPLQRVHARVEVPWSEHDWRHLPPRVQEERMRSFLREDRRAGFDPACAPLSRFALFHTADEAYRLVWTSHHALLDGFARRILLREALGEYQALVDGREWEPGPPAPSFGEYAAWLRAEDNGEAKAFWEQTLRGWDGPAELQVEPEEGEPRERHRFALPEELSEALRELAASREVTLNTVLQAAWALLLSRYTGQADAAFGATRACRRGGFPGADGVVGLLSNTVPVRIRVDEARSAAEHFHQARALWTAMRPHERTHPGRIREWTGLPAGAPLFETLLGFEAETPRDTLHPDGRGWPSRTADLLQWISYPLAVVARDGAGLAFDVVYDPARFGGEAVRRLQEHLTAILRAFAENAGQPLHRIELLPAAERQHLLQELNPPAAPYPAEQCIHHLFEAQVERTPAAVAVNDEEQSLTYAQLNERANRLAHGLRRMGVGPEVRVGICMHRGVDLVVSMLAVLKAGGAYVPLDPSSPEARLRHMLAHSGATVLLTQQALRGGLPVPEDVRVVAVDEDGLETGDGDARNPESGATPRSLAYVIFTSGSTGLPKGVGIEHGSLVSHMTWFIRDFAFTAADRVLQKTPVVFDASVWEFYAPLLVGGELVMARHEGERDPAYLARTLHSCGITTLQLVPSLFRVLLDEPELAECTSLRHLFCGGEALPGELCGRLAEVLPQARLVNLYGPAECCIDTSTHTCVAGDAIEGVVPIGRPVANTRAYVLDAAMRPLPEGIPGELYIGGVQVGRGYLGRPELTAERFLPDPFGGRAGARLYRTGDRARWRPDGTLEYLGRVDTQVKVRGFRIEPAEIEAALREHPEVRDAVVAARPAPSGDTRLVGYVIPAGREVPAKELAAHLARRVPEHMVPAAFVALEEFPLTPSGKLDRRALPEPRAAAPEHAWVEPRTPVEQVLAGLFSALLGVGRVGLGDDFFLLGGHSLLAARLALRVRTALGVQLPLHALFDARTVGRLAAVVEGLRADGEGVPEAPPIRPAALREASPLSFPQERLWFIHQMDPQSAAYNVPLVFRLGGPLDPETLRLAFEAVVRRHETLRTVYRMEEGEARQHVLPSAPFALPLLDRSADADGEAAALRLAEEEARRPFDLERGPLLRATLVRLGPDSHLLLANMHHVAGDGWSTGILTRELGACYAALAAGGEPRLAPLPVQYADFAEWQRGWLAGEVLERQLAYWREHLDGAEPLALPTDGAPGTGARRRGDRVHVQLPAALVEAARAFAREAGATPYMVLLAGFKALLSRHAGHEDVVVGTPVLGRDRPEVEGLVGFFVNTLALRTRVAADEGFRALLARVRQGTLAGYAHQHAPYERVAAELQRGGGAPLFRVMFAYDTAPEGELHLPGVEARKLQVERGAAKFDLMLTLEEGPQGIAGIWEMDADLFHRATIEGMADRFVRLLQAALAAPDLPVGDLPLLSADERAALLAAGTGAASAVPAGTVPQLVAAQVARTPQAVAVECSGARITFAELDGRTARLAGRLRALGVGPEVRVGVCLERSADLVASLLAVLKAGGAYVPLDPDDSAARLGHMLADSSVSVILTRAPFAERLPAGAARVLLIEELESGGAAGDSAEPCAGMQNLAYVLYTSGSTGLPKGVAVTHGALANHMAWMHRAFPLDAADRVLQKTPIGFDASVWEFWAPLMAGATLVVAGAQAHRDPAELLDDVEARRITILQLVPSLLRAVLDEAGPARRTALRRLYCGGEALPAELAGRARTVLGAEVINLYGPTEVCIDATTAVHSGAEKGRSVPIGRPVDNVRAYVLDARHQPVPAGVQGELYLGGAQLARGYLGRPELTAERFVPDPFAAEPGGRLYRTGDRARWLASGALEYLGRLDEQVKIRGVRVEPGEVEAALLRHPAVREAAVVVRADGRGEQRLVGYVVAAEDAAPSPAELRSALRLELPEHMVPSAFVVVDALPRTSSGKLNRRGLPAPAFAADAERYVAPRTPAEEAVAAAFAETLGVERAGVHDDFFALGGHSLLAVRLMSSIGRRTGVRVPLHALFSGGTVERLAALLGGGPGAVRPPLVAILTDGSRRPFFCVHAVDGHVLSYRALAGVLGDDRPFYGLQAAGVDGGEPLESVEEMAAAYVAALRAVQPAGPYLLGGWSLGGVVAFEAARQLRAAGEAVDLLVMLDAPRGVRAPGPDDEADFLREALRDLLSGTLPNSVSAEDLRSLTPESLTGLLRDGALSPDLDPDRVGDLLRVRGANVRALRAYHPAAADVRALLLDAAEHPAPYYGERRLLPWESLCAGGVEVRTVPGDHFTMLREPHVVTVAETLRTHLDGLEP